MFQVLFCSNSAHFTVVQNSQESGHKYRVSCSSTHLFACTTHSFTCSFTRMLLCAHLFARLLTPKLMGKWMIRCPKRPGFVPQSISQKFNSCVMHLLTDGQRDGWMDGWMDGWTDGWMDGQTHRQPDRQTDWQTAGQTHPLLEWERLKLISWELRSETAPCRRKSTWMHLDNS